MIGALAAVSLWLAVAGDDEAKTDRQARFRILRGLGVFIEAYEALLEDATVEEVLATINAITDWVTDSRNLDELGERLVEYLAMYDGVAYDKLREGELGVIRGDILARLKQMNWAGDSISSHTNRPQVSLPAFAEPFPGLSSSLRHNDPDLGITATISWDKERVLTLSPSGDPSCPTKFVMTRFSDLEPLRKGIEANRRPMLPGTNPRQLRWTGVSLFAPVIVLEPS